MLGFLGEAIRQQMAWMHRFMPFDSKWHECIDSCHELNAVEYNEQLEHGHDAAQLCASAAGRWHIWEARRRGLRWSICIWLSADRLSIARVAAAGGQLVRWRRPQFTKLPIWISTEQWVPVKSVQQGSWRLRDSWECHQRISEDAAWTRNAILAGEQAILPKELHEWHPEHPDCSWKPDRCSTKKGSSHPCSYPNSNHEPRSPK